MRGQNHPAVSGELVGEGLGTGADHGVALDDSRRDSPLVEMEARRIRAASLPERQHLTPRVGGGRWSWDEGRDDDDDDENPTAGPSTRRRRVPSRSQRVADNRKGRRQPDVAPSADGEEQGGDHEGGAQGCEAAAGGTHSHPQPQRDGDGDRDHQVRGQGIGLTDGGEHPTRWEMGTPDRIEPQGLDDGVARHGGRCPDGDGPEQERDPPWTADQGPGEAEEPDVEQHRQDPLMLQLLADEALVSIGRQDEGEHVPERRRARSAGRRWRPDGYEPPGRLPIGVRRGRATSPGPRTRPRARSASEG